MRRRSHARGASLLAVALLAAGWALAGPASAAPVADPGPAVPSVAANDASRPTDVAVVPHRSPRLPVAEPAGGRGRTGADAPWSGIAPTTVALAALLAIALALAAPHRRTAVVVGTDAVPRGPPRLLPV